MNEQWWVTVFTKGIRQRQDPEGRGYMTENYYSLPGEPPKTCDRRLSPAIITSRAAWEGDEQLSNSGGVYEGPGYYLIGDDGIARNVWKPGDKTQRPGEEKNAWKYRIGELQPEVPVPYVPGNMFPKPNPAVAHATVADVELLNKKLDLILGLLEVR
jgi:hypothetical protein